MDPTQRPDREVIAKEIDKMECGRPVTQYDVLAWMQTRKRMIKKKEERTNILKEHMMRPLSSSMHSLPPGAGAGWQHVQQPYLVHATTTSIVPPGSEIQPPPPPTEGSLGEIPLTSVGVGSHSNLGSISGFASMPQQPGMVMSAMTTRMHKHDRIKRPRMDYNDPQVFRLTHAYESGEKQDAEKLAKEIDGMEGGRQVDAIAVKAWLKNRLRFSESDRKKRQRCDFSQLQLKRLLEVYELSDVDRPDRESLAQELDLMDGGRRVSRADVKAWLKNRHHANRRRIGQDPNSSLHAKLRKAVHHDHKGSMTLNQALTPHATMEGKSGTLEHYHHYMAQNSHRFTAYLHNPHLQPLSEHVVVQAEVQVGAEIPKEPSTEEAVACHESDCSTAAVTTCHVEHHEPPEPPKDGAGVGEDSEAPPAPDLVAL